MGITQVPEQGGDIVQAQFDPKPLQSKKIGQGLLVICFARTFIFQILLFILPFHFLLQVGQADLPRLTFLLFPNS